MSLEPNGCSNCGADTENEPLVLCDDCNEGPLMHITPEQVRIIRNVFIPRNPNKMRGADPKVVEAARAFIEWFETLK